MRWIFGDLDWVTESNNVFITCDPTPRDRYG